MAWSIDELEMWVDRPAVDKTGSRLGTIVDVYMDDVTGNPEWLAVRLSGLFTNKLAFVPLEGACEDGNDVRVAYDKSVVKDSPTMQLDGDLNAHEEDRLYSYYGLTVPGSDGSELAEMQQAGSVSINEEVSPEVARQRLDRRDEDSIDFIDLDAEEKAEVERNRTDSSR